jgi:hypothetical protein
MRNDTHDSRDQGLIRLLLLRNVEYQFTLFFDRIQLTLGSSEMCNICFNLDLTVFVA